MDHGGVKGTAVLHTCVGHEPPKLRIHFTDAVGHDLRAALLHIGDQVCAHTDTIGTKRRRLVGVIAGADAAVYKDIQTAANRSPDIRQHLQRRSISNAGCGKSRKASSKKSYKMDKNKLQKFSKNILLFTIL